MGQKARLPESEFHDTRRRLKVRIRRDHDRRHRGQNLCPCLPTVVIIQAARGRVLRPPMSWLFRAVLYFEYQAASSLPAPAAPTRSFRTQLIDKEAYPNRLPSHC